MGPTSARGTSAAADTAADAAAADDAETRECYDVAVIGGGVVGHGIAWAARRSGRSVALIDDAPGSGASWAAAGMLAPVSELHYQEEALLELMLESSRLWPAFAAGLDDGRVGRQPALPDRHGYLTTPTLAVGADAADRRALADLRAVQQAHGLAVEPLTVREARAREPLLSPGISCAFDIPADHQVDPRRLLARIGGAPGRRRDSATTITPARCRPALGRTGGWPAPASPAAAPSGPRRPSWPTAWAPPRSRACPPDSGCRCGRSTATSSGSGCRRNCGRC